MADPSPRPTARNLSSTEVKRLHREWRHRSAGRVSLALDGVQGPFNVGALIRTAAAYRVETLWLTDTATGPDNPKVSKTALGTDRYLDVRREADATAVAEAARAEGFTVVGIELADGAEPLHEADLGQTVCLMFGHEDRGLSRGALGSCDRLAFIPMLGKVGSLNVATAASIALYEIRRRHWSTHPVVG
ncbi:MAG: TrmH family RNA methyltransferase [Microthrixaceae bacterium]